MLTEPIPPPHPIDAQLVLVFAASKTIESPPLLERIRTRYPRARVVAVSAPDNIASSGMLGTVLAMVISLGLLSIAMRSLPVGTAYAVWVGVGAVGTALLGIVLLGEPANAGRLISLSLILAGIIGLKLSTPA